MESETTGTYINRRIDETNAQDGYPPATDWPTRLADAYWLGWRDSQDALARSSAGARWAARRNSRFHRLLVRVGLRAAR